jgi:hypothetical protein
MAPPSKPFSSGAQQLHVFLNHCHMVFMLYPSQFASDKQKVMWAANYLLELACY